MDKDKQDGTQEQLEKHSLPGTNQAGEGPGDCAPAGDASGAPGDATLPAEGDERSRGRAKRDGATH